MQHFFLPENAFQPDSVIFPRDISRQIRLVLRLKPVEHVMALDDSGWEYEVELIEIGEIVKGRVVNKRKSEREPSVQLALYFALTQRDKVEIILQKCTEVGVAEFVPMITERALVKDPRSVNGKFERMEGNPSGGSRTIPARQDTTLKSGAFLSGCFANPSEGHRKINRLGMRETKQNQSITTEQRYNQSGFDDWSRGRVFGKGSGTGKEQRVENYYDWKRILRNETAAIVASALVIDHFS